MSRSGERTVANRIWLHRLHLEERLISMMIGDWIMATCPEIHQTISLRCFALGARKTTEINFGIRSSQRAGTFVNEYHPSNRITERFDVTSANTGENHRIRSTMVLTVIFATTDEISGSDRAQVFFSFPEIFFARVFVGTEMPGSPAAMAGDDSSAQLMLIRRAPACNEKNLFVHLEMLLVEKPPFVDSS